MQNCDMTPSSFVIHTDTRLYYAGFFVLKEILEKRLIFSFHLDDDEAPLEPILHWLEEHNYLRLNAHSEYEVTRQGRSYVRSFLHRYQSFQEKFKIFCGVDLKARDFALRYYPSIGEGMEWDAFLNEERWEDLRVAIAEYEGLDSIELIFMGFVHENRFGRNADGWDYDALMGSIWDEIQSICNTAVRFKNLHCPANIQSSEVLLRDIIQKGRQLAQEL